MILHGPHVVMVLALTFGSVAIALSQASEQSRSAPPDAVEGVRRLRAADIAATKAFDVDALAALWADDIVAMAPGRAPVVGKRANLASLRAMRREAAGLTAIEYQQDWRDLQIVGDHAFEWGVFTSAFRTKDGSIVRQRHNVLRILRHHPDGWKIARTIWNEISQQNR